MNSVRLLLLASLTLLPLAADAEPTDTPSDSPVELALPARIEALEMSGEWRTKRWVIERELPWKTGEEVSVEQWTLGLERLWNMGLFSRVSGRLEEREDSLTALLELESRWTTMLLLQTGGGGGAAWFRTGLYDINTFGRYIETGALYERFQKYNGFQLWLRHPRLFDERQELYVVFDRLVRPRIGFSLLRTAARAEYTKQLSDRLVVGGRLEGFHDVFEPPMSGAEQRPKDSQSLIATAFARRGRVNTVRLLSEGWQVDLKPLVGITNADGFPSRFTQIFAEAIAFQRFGSIASLGARVQAGLSSEVQEQHRFHLGGLDTIRGYPDNRLRADRFALVNLEARFVAFDSTWIAFMPTVFLDAAAARDDRSGPTVLVSGGAGIRVLLPRLYRSGARIDFPVPLTPLGRPSLSFGVFQFF